MPSKESYRQRTGQAAKRQWTRIKRFEELVGWRARAAARPGQLGRMFGEALFVEILLCRQRIDPDNIKVLIDSLKGVVFPDDSKRYVRRIEVIAGDEETYEESAVIFRVGVWE